VNLENPQQSCQEWQRILKLQDWDVLVAVPSGEAMDEAEGQVTFDLGKKIADIKLVTPEGYPFDAMRPYQMEETLVHELLHLHFAPFDAKTGTPKGVAQEQAINAIARALVNLKNANLSTQGDAPNPSPTS